MAEPRAVRKRGTEGAGARDAGSRWRAVPRLPRIALQFLLTALVTWIIVDRVGVGLEDALDPGAAVRDLHLGLLAASVALLLLCFAAAARLWGWMVGELGGRDPGPGSSIRIVLTANLGRYLPGKLWQVAGLALLSRRAGVPASIGTAAGALGQLFHLAGAGVVGIAALGNVSGAADAGGRLALALLALLVLLASVPRLLGWGLRVTFRLCGLDESAAPRPGPLFGPRWILLHTLVWAGYGAAFVLLARALGLPGSGITLGAAFGAAYLLGYLAIFAPAGLGVREGVLVALLRPSLGGAAVGLAVFARIWMTLVELAPAGGVALWEIFRRRDRTAIDEGEPADGRGRENG